MNRTPIFLVGGRYANRRGEYEVLAINGDKMDIEYDDGSRQNVSTTIQARILENISIQAAVVSPYDNSQLASNQRYFESIGFLSIRATMLEAIIPPHSLEGFRTTYQNIKQVIPRSGQAGFYVHDPSADKWGCELRITYSASEPENANLDFGPGVNIVTDPGNPGSWRINNNGFWWRLLRFGFEMGTTQVLTNIRVNIPNQYQGSFDNGVVKAR